MMKVRDLKQVKLPVQSIRDSRKVRIGGYSPALQVRKAPASVTDSGKVRIGGYGSVL